MEHAEKALPEVDVTLDGKTYTVACTLAVLNRFEKRTGKNSLDDATWARPPSLDLTALLWAAVSTKDPTITFEFVEQNVKFSDLGQVGQIVQALFRQQSPAGSGDEKHE